MRTLRPLNYMPYDKKMALKELEETVGYKPYPRKHGESLFTKLFQNYYLPKKFGMDKRRPPADVHSALVRAAPRHGLLHGAVGPIPGLYGSGVASDLPRNSAHKNAPFA